MTFQLNKYDFGTDTVTTTVRFPGGWYERTDDNPMRPQPEPRIPEGFRVTDYSYATSVHSESTWRPRLHIFIDMTTKSCPLCSGSRRRRCQGCEGSEGSCARCRGYRWLSCPRCV